MRREQSQPFFSVIVANYNYGRLVGESIESVLAQSDPDFELIVVDDGSTDDSRDVIDSFDDPRLIRVYTENGGQAAAFNHGFERARGEVICFLDSDDWWSPEKLATVRRWHEFRRGEYGLLQHQVEVWAGRPAGPFRTGLYCGDVLAEMDRTGRQDYFVPTSGLCAKRELLQKIFPLPTVLRIGADGFITRTMVLFGPLISIPEALGYYRRHQNWVFGNEGFDVDGYFQDSLFPVLRRFYKEHNVEFRFRFADRVDTVLLRELVRERWERLAEKYAAVAVYGAGKHSEWLELLVKDRRGPRVVSLLDDSGATAPSRWGLQAETLESSRSRGIPVVISSDAHRNTMLARCREVLGDAAPLIDLYENLPADSLARVPK